MRITYNSIVFAFLFLVGSEWSLAQAPGIGSDSVSAIFTKFLQTNTDKSFVLVTDRSVYMAGERIWFKANVVNATRGRLDLTFKNLFADLVNEKDSVIDQMVLDNVGLRTEGCFRLPSSIPTGYYWVRCYTARELGNDSSGIFLHPVYIVNKQLHDESEYAKQFERNIGRQAFNPSIKFFPERLTAFPGIISTGVLEIKNGYQNPLSVNGQLVNSKDSTIANFTTNSLGLARLNFVNDPAEKYTAIIYWKDRVLRYQLPGADKNSIQLSVINQTANSVKAFVTLEDSVAGDTHTTILAVKNGKLYFAAVGTGEYEISIPLDKFPGGIVRLLLFTDNKILVSERKIYIPKQNVVPEIKTDKNRYNTRENVGVHIRMTGPGGKPLAATLNVAVQNELMVQFSDSIEANTIPPPGELLLDGWLSAHPSKYSDEDIDRLLVTKKSNLQQRADTVSSNSIVNFDSGENLQNLTGTLIDKKGNGLGGRIVGAIAKDSGAIFMDVDTTDKNGVFSLAIPQGFAGLQLSVQVTDRHRQPNLTDSIKIDRFQYPIFPTPLSSKESVLPNNNNALALIRKYNETTTIAFNGIEWLPPVTVNAKVKKELNYDVTKRLNSMSQIITSDKFRYYGANSLGNALLTVPGVTLAFGDVSIFGPDVDLAGHVTRPLIIMDGYALPGNGGIMDFLNSLNPADIDFIEVLRGAEAAIYGVRGSAGVISINTRHGPDKNYTTGNLRLITPVTYHVCPKFEMPDYSVKEIKNSPFPDSRTTIYWNGNVRTDANGEADLSFYTGDNAANYTITVSGLAETGELVYKRMVIANTGKAATVVK